MVTLVLNSPEIDGEVLAYLAPRSILIGVDGGLNSIATLNLSPDWVVGDFDSVEPGLIAQLPTKTKIWRVPVEKEYTDMELALGLARTFRPHRLNILGLGGGERFDHQLVNSLLLSNLARSGCEVNAWSGQQKITFTTKSKILYRAQGQMFSVLTFSRSLTVNIRGAKYQGVGLRISPGSGYGLGNEIIQPQALLGIRGGVAGICQW